MDVILYLSDTYLGLDHLYALAAPANSTSSLLTQLAAISPPCHDFAPAATASIFARDNVVRQAFSLFAITWFFGLLTYFMAATLSYIFIFDHRTFDHPKYLKNQVRLEIAQASRALPVMAILTTPWFLAEVRGYSKMYTSISHHGWLYGVLQFPLFLVFTDSLIYLIHRALHSKVLYKRLHKPHHKWIMPTPFASHAFHPLDGYMQSLPYHIFPFIFPLHSYAYIALFSFINVWTVAIHDGEYLATDPIINGAACHSLHHLKFSCNYGQFTTLFDRLGGSYVKPDKELFDKAVNRASWERQAKEVESIQRIVEKEDFEGESELIERTSVFEEKKKN